MPPSPIFGSFYVSRSQNLADNRCINLFPEIVEDQSGKQAGALYNVPGLSLWLTVGTGPIRGMWNAGLFLYVASDSEIFRVSQDMVVTKVGDIGNNVTGVARGYVSTIGTNTLSPIALPFASTFETDTRQVRFIDNGRQVAAFFGLVPTYQDGFGLIPQPGTSFFFQSNLLDLSTWQALNFGDASADPDNIVALAQIRREIFVIKERHTEVWVNAGVPGFTFQRLDGVYEQVGCVAPQSVTIANETLKWLGRNSQGQDVVASVDSYAPARISTHAIENQFQGFSRTDDAMGYAYQLRGHSFYVLAFPTANQTWAFDSVASELAKMPMWHQMAGFDPNTGNFNRHASNCFAFFAGNKLVGDYRSGNIYILDDNSLTDAGAQRKFLRSWRGLKQASMQPQRYASLQIDMQTGIQIPDGTNPQCMLRWSDDGGHNWSDYRIVAVGKTGETAQRIKFNRLGSTRRNSGLDRIFEWSTTDQFPIAIIGADVL